MAKIEDVNEVLKNDVKEMKDIVLQNEPLIGSVKKHYECSQNAWHNIEILYTLRLKNR